MERQVVVTVADGLATVELNRPEKLNAVGQELADALEDAFREVRAQKARCAILRGRGRAFCVGADLAAGDKENPAAAEAWINRIASLVEGLRTLPCPVVAYVHGYALGLGATLAMGADLVVAADDAKLGFPEVHHGLVPGVTMALLVERVSALAANEIILLGERFGAAEAKEYGIVNRVVPAAEADAAVADLAERLMRGSPMALKASKRLLAQMGSLPPRSRMAAGVDAVLTGRQSEDAKEGFASFREKRKPSWVKA